MKTSLKSLLIVVALVTLSIISVSAQNDSEKQVVMQILNGHATSLPKPEYKEEWKNADIKGVVYVAVTIDEQGNVSAAEVVDPLEAIRSLTSQNTNTMPYEMPHPLLQQAAVEAAQKAKFRITMSNGIAVGYKGMVVYSFSPTRVTAPVTINAPDSPPTPPMSPPRYGGPVSAGVMNGRALTMPLPEYPAQAKTAKIDGSVSVQVTVDENGNVVAAQAVSGHPMLRQSAVIAAREAKFEPTLVNGEAKKVSGILVYNFASQVSTTTDFDDPNIVKMGVLNGRAKSLPAPAYTAQAQAAKVSGSVSVQIVIDEAGDVISAMAVSGHPMLRQAAVDAARNAKFTPTMTGNQVKVSGIIVYNFVL